MITTAPLPLYADLGRALGGATAGISPWLKPWDSGLLSPRSAWSLAAIASAISRRQGLPPRVLLPGWICNQSLWPLRRMGAELLFLPVRPDGAMEWETAEALGSLDMVVVVHPFGCPARLDAARDFANRRGALLVEDAAHCLMPGPGIHESGDVVLYSPHKLVATPAGGVIAIRPRAEAWADAIAEELGDMTMSPPEAANEWRWLARRLAQTLIPDALRPLLPQGGQADFASDPPTIAMEPPLAPSRLAQRLLDARDLEAEATRRRDNETALRELVAPLADLRPLFPAGDWIPYRMALRAASPKAAAERYRALRAARLPVETWPDMAPEVTADPCHGAGAVALRSSVLLLPVHGALDPKRLASAYGKVLR
ncbi:hypothetical protein A6A04_03390 [Paramagnetospirillum marisnigri]|uniref:Uncharacterized protein n=1 Tax=Paramagnetospirillum marisnigri TaxID=1285242 RepID=A0A178MKB3_9PROT|nr:DegT/DnrJ/EryC1/StrS family aminotransferase [Paramagnetospirillum marisnigri]OAN49171.1 hypothetical protein A6A04_03390 [Paramagnetospirillum marisnigri]